MLSAQWIVLEYRVIITFFVTEARSKSLNTFWPEQPAKWLLPPIYQVQIRIVWDNIKYMLKRFKIMDIFWVILVMSTLRLSWDAGWRGDCTRCVGSDNERVDLLTYLWVIGRLLDDLWGHPKRCTHKSLPFDLRVCQLPRHTEVCQLHLARLWQQHVCGYNNAKVCETSRTFIAKH